MGWTKREIITQAFGEIGLASYVFDLSAEQLQSALRTLDSMMASWNARGLRLGYPIPSTAGGSDLDHDSGVPDRANEAIVTALAIRLASSVGKAVSPELKQTAKAAYDALLLRIAMPPEQQFPSGMPAGAGNKAYGTGSEYLTGPTEGLAAGDDDDLEFD